jgi:hypothetical protein
MKKLILGIALCLGVPALAQQDFDTVTPPANDGLAPPAFDTRNPPPAIAFRGQRIWEQRVLYNAVKFRGNRYAACGGQAPRSVRTKRTAGDFAAMIVSLGIWTPAHTFVRC